jgi:hypothetical protein
MSATLDREDVKHALKESGAAWIFEYWGDAADRQIDEVCTDIEEFIAEYQHRFGEAPDPIRLLRTNPAKGMAFFQIDTFRVSLEMKIMIWRILMGCEIVRVQFNYQLGSPIGLSITLRTPYGAEDPPYDAGGNNEDFRVLRHLGAVGTQGGLMELQGYHALRAPS